LFLAYRKVAGMTGTVANSGRELLRIYRTPVANVPTNRPVIRRGLPDRVFGSSAAKWEAIVKEIRELNAQGRPILIGTRSIDKSEQLSAILTGHGLEHQVLNARHLAREAEIVAQAGQAGRITVATNMAGRGTDIQLGEESRQAGGLHVICTELHESARIDRQLIGRCGRQGDPGTFRCFMSLDDDLLQAGFGPKRAKRLKRYGEKLGELPRRWSSLFRRAQRRVERKHFRARKMLLYHEQQRQKIQREMGQDPFVDTVGT
jgi:preprotein translocase subunit SecA